MGIDIGSLNTVIAIQRIPLVTNADGDEVRGEPIAEWSNVAARFLDVTGREFVQAKQMSAELVGIIEIHFRRGVTPRHCLEYQGRRLNLIAVVDPGERHEVLHLHYKEAT